MGNAFIPNEHTALVKWPLLVYPLLITTFNPFRARVFSSVGSYSPAICQWKGSSPTNFVESIASQEMQISLIEKPQHPSSRVILLPQGISFWISFVEIDDIIVAGPVRLLLVLWMYSESLERDQAKVVLPQHSLECMGSWCCTGKIPRHELRWFWEYIY